MTHKTFEVSRITENVRVWCSISFNRAIRQYYFDETNVNETDVCIVEKHSPSNCYRNYDKPGVLNKTELHCTRSCIKRRIECRGAEFLDW